MRLIDADKLIEEIKQEIDMRYMYSPKGFINVINNQPTAYNVDKVVEQLEKYQETLYYYHDAYTSGQISAYDKAIKVVKAGGIR